MASVNAPRPWRPLGALALLLVVLYGTMALLGEWTPRLGLDLRGGTSITLSARTADGTDVTDDSMRQAVDIIRARVDGSGVAESEITTQGRTNIVVQVPDVGEEELVQLVGQTAELRFRPVRAVIPGGSPAPVPTPTETGTPNTRSISSRWCGNSGSPVVLTTRNAGSLGRTPRDSACAASSARLLA